MIQRTCIKNKPSGYVFEVGKYRLVVDNDRDANLIAYDTTTNKLLRKEKKVTVRVLDAVLTALEDLANSNI